MPIDAIAREDVVLHPVPIGATGAVLTTRLLHAMRRDGIRRGGGQRIALALAAD